MNEKDIDMKKVLSLTIETIHKVANDLLDQGLVAPDPVTQVRMAMDAIALMLKVQNKMMETEDPLEGLDAEQLKAYHYKIN